MRIGGSLTLFYANAHSVNLTFSVRGFREMLNRADIVYADGIGLEIAARAQGERIRENLTGTDFLPKVLRFASEKNWSVYFLGGEEDVARRAGERAKRELPTLQLAGWHHGFFSDTEELIGGINRAGPVLLFVGLGSPLQERWVHENRGRLNCRIVITVGGFFDFYSGCTMRAPVWMRRMRMEWLFRLLCDPVRMFSRYVLGNPLFLWRVLRIRLNRSGAAGSQPTTRFSR